MPLPHHEATRRSRATTLGGALVAAALLVLSACTGTSDGQVEVVASTAAPAGDAATTTTRPPDCAETLPPAAQAGQMLMVMVTAPQLATEAIASGRVGGFGLKGRQSADVGEEVAAATVDAPVPPFVASDEEGGTVQRLAAALGELTGAATLGEGSAQDAARLVGDYAAGMADLGFNMNFGPVADVGSGSDLGSRSFGDDPAAVAEFVEEIVAAQSGAGIHSVVKHWPGIGGGDSDPHVALDELAPIAELRAADLTVFDRAIAAGAPGIMVAHATVPGLTADDEPASLSRDAITGELRERQGFDGLVITDSLGMGAVVNTVPQDEAAVRAIAAGADVALVSGADVVDDAHRRLTAAITQGDIPADQVAASVRRVLDLKGITGQCLELVPGFSDLQQETTSTVAGDDGSTGSGDRAVTDSGIDDTGMTHADDAQAVQGRNGAGSGVGSGTGPGSGTGGDGGAGGSGNGSGSGSGVGNGSGPGTGSGSGGGGSDATG